VAVQIAGVGHNEPLPDGTLAVVLSGRNIIYGSQIGLVFASGRFSFITSENFLSPLEGNGHITDLCELLQ
jgi:hypothetical protein